MEPNFYKFPCGCKFDIIDGQLNIDMEKINLDCPATWELLAKGDTKGVFQLESQLGKKWTKELKPESIEHLSALGSILRPGCLRAFEEGKSLTQHYCDRKNNIEPVTYFHPSLEPILKDTYGVLVYQEQTMAIAQQIAGFNLIEADSLRKAVGKKLAKEMMEIKDKFIQGAEAKGVVTKEEAEHIFGWIEKSSRYGFNHSHAASYGKIGYYTAFLKTHFTIEFYTEYLRMADEKQKPFDEIDELVNDIKIHDFEIKPPTILKPNDTFFTDHNNTIWFGLVNVKDVGHSHYKALISNIRDVEIKLNKKIDMWSFNDFLIHLKIQKRVARNLILVGTFSHFKKYRSLMIYEFDQWSKLTDKERDWIRANVDYNDKSLSQIIDECIKGGGYSNKNRKVILEGLIYLLEKPPHELKDTMGSIAYHEATLLGTTISFSKVGDCNTEVVNCSCREFLDGKDGYLVLGVEIKRIKEINTKNKQKMAFVNIGDNTAACDGTVFSKQLEKYKNLLKVGNTVLIKCSRDKKYKSLIINEVIQL